MDVVPPDPGKAPWFYTAVRASRMTMHTLDRRDNSRDSATALAANNSFLREKLRKISTI